jgi:hypothetical protein
MTHLAGWFAQSRKRSRVTSSAAPVFEKKAVIAGFVLHEKVAIRCIAEIR